MKKIGKGYGFKMDMRVTPYFPPNYSNVMSKSLHHSLAAETSSQACFLKQHGSYLGGFMFMFLFSALPSLSPHPAGLCVGLAAWWCRSPMPEPRGSPARAQAAAAPVNPRPAQSPTPRARAAPARVTAASPRITPAQR